MTCMNLHATELRVADHKSLQRPAHAPGATVRLVGLRRSAVRMDKTLLKERLRSRHCQTRIARSVWLRRR